MTRPVRSRTSVSRPRCFSASHAAAVRRSCQTIALAIGSPVARFQITVVSRWLVMPIAAMSAAASPALAIASRAVASCELQISFGSCSTQPGCGKICRNSRCASATIWPRASKTIARELDVPWSRASRCWGRSGIVGSSSSADARIVAMPQDDVDRIPTAARREVDVLVVGGGINGVGIARDLAGRGARVVLCEQDDLASHTSGASTKLIHGGLRYLEYYDFGLVRKALAEREVLLKANPHIMRPLSFVMPHDPSMRAAWMIRIGLFLYDHLARREVLSGSRTVDLHAHVAGAPLRREFTKGFVYSDGWVDDARLVALCAVDAAERGATVLTRTACVDAVRGADHWQVRLRSARGGTMQVAARCLVNAAGPWAGEFLTAHAHVADRVQLRLVKGSHIVVKRLFDHELAYIFQNADGRIIFAI